MIAFLKGLEIYDGWFALSSLLLRDVCLLSVYKIISSNLLQNLVFSFAKIYVNSSLNLT